MDKIRRRIVTITIIETWTIAWADGAASTIIYGLRHRYATLPTCPTDPPDEIDLDPIATDAEQYSALTHVAASTRPCEIPGASISGSS